MSGFCVMAHLGSWASPPKSFQMFLCQTGLCVVVLMAYRSPSGPQV